MTFFNSNCHCIDPTVKAVEQQVKYELRHTHASDDRCAIEGIEDYYQCA
jgi:hypothetical protein